MKRPVRLALVLTAWLLGAASGHAHEADELIPEQPGLAIGLAANLALRAYVKARSDRHERQYHPKLPPEPSRETPAC